MSTKSKNLGRLEKVGLREVWANEASDFTPWLAQPENIALLGDAIGLELEVEEREKRVGRFSADILCKDTATGNWVLIENQMERTDHTHLGQLLTYAAGLKAVTIVWIADRFTEEHRAALDWLNEITDERFNFFGLEIGLWQIGDSAQAPKLNIVSKPNDWSRAVASTAAKNLTETQQLQLEFWTGFREYMLRNGSTVSLPKALPQWWMSFGIGTSKFYINAVATVWDYETKRKGHGVSVELVSSDEDSREYFTRLRDMENTITSEFGKEVKWYEPEDRKTRRLYLRKSVELTDREHWDEHFAWLQENVERFNKLFRPFVREIVEAVKAEKSGEI